MLHYCLPLSFFLPPFFSSFFRTKLSLTRWSADWRNATELYEKAGGLLICFNIVITYSDKFFELEFITLIGSSLVNVSVSVEAVAFRYKKDNAKAKEAFEKASKGQEILSSYPFVLKLKL